MSRTLSDLLGASEPSFTNMLHRLESLSGHPSVDVRLTADIDRNVRTKSKELGLDPTDTNGRELYHALQHLVQKHDEFLTKAVGGSDPSDVADLLPRLVAQAKKLYPHKSCWAIKHSVAKRLLRNLPPKKVMKTLGYRSLDSMLKREDIGELFVALRLVESPTWLARFTAGYKRLQPGDFETRRISILQMPAKRWGDVAQDFIYKNRHNITNLKELGVVAVLPMPVAKMRGVSISVLPMLIHHINETRMYSAYFKLLQVRPNFGSLVASAFSRGSDDIVTIAGQPVPWRVIHHYFGRLRSGDHPEVFEPYVQPDDLASSRAEQLLYRLEPALKFWEDMDYSAVMHDGRPVPLGLMDNAASYCNNLAYGQQSVQNFQDSLYKEVFVRYIGQPSLEGQIIQQLDNEVSEPEMLLANAGGDF